MITQGKIGGSLIAAVAGIHPKMTLFDAARRIIEGHQSPSGIAARMGICLEPLERAVYAEETGHKLLGPQTVTNPLFPWAEAHLDDRTEDRVVELKTTTVRLAHEWGEANDAVPLHHLCQVQFYMAMTGLKAADIFALIGNEDFRIYPIQEDKQLQGMLIEAGARFHRDYIVPGKMPPIDGSKGCADWIADKYPRESKPLLAADDLTTRMVTAWRSAKAAIETAEQLEAEARNMLIAHVGENEGFIGGNYKLTYKAQKGRASTDWKSLVRAASVPESLVTRFTKEGTPFRVLRFTEKKQ